MRYWFVLLLGMSIVAAQAQEQLLPSEKKQQTVVTEPASLYKGFLRGGVSGYFGTVDKYFDAHGNKTYFPGNIWGGIYSTQLGFVYGVTDRLQVSAVIPYVWNNASQLVVFEIPSPDPTKPDSIAQVKYGRPSSGLGDVSVGIKYQVFTETERRPAIYIVLDATIPTGEKNPTGIIDSRNYAPAVGNGEYKLNIGFGFRKVSYPFSYSLNADYMYKFPGEKVQEPYAPELPFKSSDYLDFIGTFNFHLNDWIAVQNELSYFYYMNNGSINNQLVDFPTQLLQYSPRVSFQVKRLRLNEGALIPLTGINSSADVSFIVLIQYTF
jgi:hypothetical protein